MFIVAAGMAIKCPKECKCPHNKKCYKMAQNDIYSTIRLHLETHSFKGKLTRKHPIVIFYMIVDMSLIYNIDGKSDMYALQPKGKKLGIQDSDGWHS